MSNALLLMFAILATGMAIRVPIAFSMLAGGIAYLSFKGQDLGLAAEQILNGLYNGYVLLAVPLFIFAANVMNAGTISTRLFDFAKVLVGRMRGGLAQGPPGGLHGQQPQGQHGQGPGGHAQGGLLARAQRMPAGAQRADEGGQAL